MAVTETWLTPSVPDSIVNVPNFRVFRDDRKDRRGGGTCIFTRYDLRCHEYFPSFVKPKCIEVSWLQISSLKLLFCCIYIPPAMCGDDKKSNTQYLIDVIDVFLMSFPSFHVAIVGDFNDFCCDVFVQQLDMRNLVDFSTRQNSQLDKCFVSNDFLDKHSVNMERSPPIASSDHNTIIFDYSSQNEVKDSFRIVKVPDFRRSHLENFSRALDTVNFLKVYESPNVDDMCEVFYEQLNFAICSTIPMDYVIFTQRDKPWITPVLKVIINKRWQAYKSGDMKLYNHYKCKAKIEIDKAKKLWASNASCSAKQLWNVVRDFDTKRRIEPISLLDGDHCTDKLDNVTDTFQASFSQRDVAASQKHALKSPSVVEISPCVNIGCVYRLLKRLDIKKSAGRF